MDKLRLTEIRLHQTSKILSLVFADGKTFDLPCEYLRIFTPSAEARGTGSESGVLVEGKRAVNITHIEPVGRYAVKLLFDDDHDTGLYAFDYLYELGVNQAHYFAEYLLSLERRGGTRDPRS